jgi:hypothetical protein
MDHRKYGPDQRGEYLPSIDARKFREYLAFREVPVLFDA